MKLTIVILCTLSLLVVEAPGLTNQMGWFSFGSSSTTSNQTLSSVNNATIPGTSLQNITLANANTILANSTKSLTTVSSSSYSYRSLLNPFYWFSGSTNSTTTSSSTPGISPLSRLSFRRNQPEQQDVAKRMDASDDPTIGPFQSNRIGSMTTTTIAPTIPAVQEVPIKRTNANSSVSSNLQPRLLPGHHHLLNHHLNRATGDSNATSTVTSSPSPRPVATIKATLVTNSSSMRSSYMLNGNNNVNGSSISNMFTTSRPSMSRSIGGIDPDTHSLIRQKTPKMTFVRRNNQNHLVHNYPVHHHQVSSLVNQTTTQTPATPAPTPHVSSLSANPESNNQSPVVLVVMPTLAGSDEPSASTPTNVITTTNNNRLVAHDQNTSSIATRRIEHQN